MFLKITEVFKKFSGHQGQHQLQYKPYIFQKLFLRTPLNDCPGYTAQKIKFSIRDFFSKCDQICRKLRIWSHLLKKYLMENFILCVLVVFNTLTTLSKIGEKLVSQSSVKSVSILHSLILIHQLMVTESFYLVIPDMESVYRVYRISDYILPKSYPRIHSNPCSGICNTKAE